MKEWAKDKPHALRALVLLSLHPRPDRRGYYKKRVRCTLIIKRTHEPCVPNLLLFRSSPRCGYSRERGAYHKCCLRQHRVGGLSRVPTVQFRSYCFLGLRPRFLGAGASSATGTSATAAAGAAFFARGLRVFFAGSAAASGVLASTTAASRVLCSSL